MKKKSGLFRLVDVLLLLMTVLPIVCGMVIKVLTKPAAEGIEISGAGIFFTIKLPLQDLPITESQVNSWLVIVSVFFLCLYLTHGLATVPNLRRQHLVEWGIEKVENMVNENMGEYFHNFVPFVAAIMVLSAFSSLLTLVGLYPPTSDLNVVAGWAVLVFFLITYYKFKCGPAYYLKSFAEPVAFLAPINIISEFATPVSMAFRHYGNVLSGTVISVLVASGLQGISAMVFGNLSGIIGEVPFFQIGIPAVLSIYFDIFSGCLQAFIFAMLTMLYVSSAFPSDEYEERRRKKLNRQKAAS